MTTTRVIEHLVLRVEQIEPGQRPPRSEPNEVAWRTLDGFPVCQQHALELRDYMPGEEFRRVLDEDTIESYVVEFGLRREDLMILHGPRIDERCLMCTTCDSDNSCLNCERPLHPKWPAVYCSTRCAQEDA